jgi:DNA polymerase-3 subunit gamma/tau
MSLYKKYRPTTLDDVMGNKSTTDSIESILNRKTGIPSAWLFSGPSGCGKTTLARIVAARLGVSDSDLRELNIGNLRGIDNAREIQEQMTLRPINGTHRAWILDEVHMATKEFQNAMLKTLEDTPKHVLFFLCTTDPQKLIKTVRDRCTQYQVESLSERKVERLLVSVCKKESVHVPNEVILQIAKDSYGSARAALVVLDKIMNLSVKDMKAAAEQTMLEQNEAIELARTLVKGGAWPPVAKILKGMGEYEVEGVRQLILAYCNSILMSNDNPRVWLVMDCFRETFDRNGRPGMTMACYAAMSEK